LNVLVFNIETIPDIEGGQAIFDLQGLDDASTAKAMMHMHQQKTGSDFLPLHLHKIVAISVLYRGMDDGMGRVVSVHSLGDENSTERDLLKLFFEEVDSKKPTILSWNGSYFDLTVIRYRALQNTLSLPEYWSEDGNYHHSDVKHALSMHNPDASAPLNHIAKQLGFPGKIMGMDGCSFSADGSIWGEYQAGNLKGIRDYCETDVLNIYLVYLRYQLMLGKLTHEQLEQEFTLLRDALESQSAKQSDGTGQNTHLGAFLKAW